MQLITMEDSYCGEKFKNLTPDQYSELRVRIKELDLPEKVEDIPSYYSIKVIGVMEDLEYLTDLGFKLHITRVRGLFAEALPKLGVPETSDRIQVVNITIPSAGLFSVQTLTVIENDCTNTVQSFLDRGWRIVAVCPPNDTRRPTFILGHADKAAE